jgi:tRNA A37 threonylcarbamoyladenosine modification protein TsaB
MHKKVDLLLIALSSPIIIGIYEEKKLIKTVESTQKSSDILPLLFQEIFQEYEVEHLIYANGPGSFMAIKVAYIFLKSLSIVKKIPLYAVDAFYFNENRPIKAIGKLYFVKVASEIKTEKFDEKIENDFKLPEQLDYNDFKNNTTVPLYSIGAV